MGEQNVKIVRHWSWNSKKKKNQMFETYKGHRLIISELPVELEPKHCMNSAIRFKHRHMNGTPDVTVNNTSSFHFKGHPFNISEFLV